MFWPSTAMRTRTSHAWSGAQVPHSAFAPMDQVLGGRRPPPPAYHQAAAQPLPNDLVRRSRASRRPTALSRSGDHLPPHLATGRTHQGTAATAPQVAAAHRRSARCRAARRGGTAHWVSRPRVRRPPSGRRAAAQWFYHRRGRRAQTGDSTRESPLRRRSRCGQLLLPTPRRRPLRRP